MQAIFANFPNKLALNFPQNIVHQIFHEMSNILYISDFPDFPDSPQIFQSMDFSADSPQLYRIRRFSRFSILRKLSADFPRQVFQIFSFTGSARFSADFSACQIFQFFHTKKSTLEFSRVPCCYAVSITRMQLLTFVCCPSSKTM